MSSRDQIPLLNERGEAHDEQPDDRFAIDEETAEAQGASSTNDGVPSSPKYPPTAPPPSYREATGKSLASVVCSRFCSTDHLPDFSSLRRLGSNVWVFICRFWPTSRFAQVGLFMMGLWVLVIVSGPAFEDMGPRAGAGYPWDRLEEIANGGPGPISGDGHIVAQTNWTFRSCQSSPAHHGQVVCLSTSRVELDIPPQKSFDSNEAIFIFADPPRRDHLADLRGKVPGKIIYKLVEEGSGPEQSPAGKVQVIIDAEYEQNKIEVFEKSTIVKMGSRIYSQGIGIYTHPLPTRYQHLDTAPMTLTITVLIPAGSSIPAFRTESSAMNVEVFTQPSANRRRRRRDSSTSVLAAPYFGLFVIRTGTGTITTGAEAKLNARGLIHFSSSNGDLVLRGDMHSQEFRAETLTGSIRMQEGCHITAWLESKLTSKTGDIALSKDSWLLSAEILGKTSTGSIVGGLDSGLWRNNKTLQLHSANGPIRANVEVVKPTDAFFNPIDVVFVAAESKNGLVDLRYVSHEANTALHSTVSTSLGTASAQMHKNFEGVWSIEGSKTSDVTPPPPQDARQYKSLGRNEGIINVKEHGEIWVHPEEKHREEAQSFVTSSTGLAHLRFAP